MIQQTREDLLKIINAQTAEIAQLRHTVELQNSVIKELDGKLAAQMEELGEQSQDIEYIGTEIDGVKKRISRVEKKVSDPHGHTRYS
jgi:chromosome segregation ATPase